MTKPLGIQRTCRPVYPWKGEEFRVGCFGLATIVDAGTVSMVARAKSQSDLPWVGLAADILIETTPAATMLREAVVRPRLQKPSGLLDEIRGVYTRWKRLVGNWRDGVVAARPPKTHKEVMDTYFWYPT
jgi:hypothetical protein